MLHYGVLNLYISLHYAEGDLDCMDKTASFQSASENLDLLCSAGGGTVLLMTENNVKW